MAANWKVLAENYNECYHCGPVHPELCALIPAFRHGGAGLEWEAGVPHREGAWTLTTTGTSARAPFPGLDDAERTRHKGELVYPNLLLSLAAEHVAAYSLRPRGPARTTVLCDLLFHPHEIASGRFDPSDAAELWDLVNRQDWAICESVQRGMSSRGVARRVVRPDGGRVGRHLPLVPDCDGMNIATVGLGAIGSATAYWLASRGVGVTGFEQFELGHVRGASHDHSRIIRRSYHTRGYVELTAGAYDAWEAVERESGHTIVTRTGGIDLFPPDAAIDPQAYTSSLAAAGVPFEWIDGAEVARRWPAFAGGPAVADAMAIFQSDTGIVPAARATETLQRLASGRGAHLRPHTPVRAVRPVGDEVDVVTDDGVERFTAVVLACDAWVNRLLAPLGHSIPLVVLREQVSYFPAADLGPFQPGRLPVWIWMDDPSFYGFPVYGDTTAVKAAEDCGGAEVDPDNRGFDPDPAAEARVARFMRQLVGGALSGEPRSTTCLYTLTADRDFVLDRLPDHPQVLVALGAAHGFKFASWFGRTLADLVVDGTAEDELSAFALTRPSLHRAVDREAWLV